MDYILGKKDVDSQSYETFALTCLIIAAKYDELDRNIPSDDEFICACSSSITKQAVIECEMKCLLYLDWNLRVVTSIVFINLFLSQGALFTTDIVGRGIASDAFAKQISRSVNNLANLAVESTENH